MAINKTTWEKTLASNTEYFRYIFKKTEKIACAVFYILEDTKSDKQENVVIKDLEKTALETINLALVSLQSYENGASLILTKLRHSLIGLQSKLRVLHASHRLSPEHLHVFVDEIDSVVRTLNNFLNIGSKEALFLEEAMADGPVRLQSGKARSFAKQNRANASLSSADLGRAGGNSLDRRTRIIEALKSKKDASIKDISEVVTDCSEKTIQRELNSLINDSLVSRKGQRRWSTYSLT